MDPYSRHLSSFKSHQAWLAKGQPTIMVNGQPYPANTTVVINGQAYPIVPGTAKQRKELGAGGFRMDSDLVFVISSDVFPNNAAPTLLQTAVYLNQSYRIDAIQTLAGGTLQRFECNDPNPA